MNRNKYPDGNPPAEWYEPPMDEEFYPEDPGDVADREWKEEKERD